MDTKKNILWIEDESYKLEHLLSGIDENIFKVFPVKNTKDAIDEITKNSQSYSLILLDIILPQGIIYSEEEYSKIKTLINNYAGFKILETIIAHKIKIPIIIITIVTENHLREKIKEYRKRPDLNIVEVLSKGMLKSTRVKEAIYKVFNMTVEND